MNRSDFKGSNLNGNNFTLLRLLAAYFVLISNSFVVLQKPLEQPALWYNDKSINFGGVGYDIFFSISGFLVTQSLFNSNSLKHYFWKRILRTVPALAVANLVCIIFGCFITTLSLKEYITNTSTWTFILKNTTLLKNQFYLPGVFESLKDPTVNASLGSILIGVGCCLTLFFAAYFIVIRKWLYLACFVLFEAMRVYFTIFNNYHLESLNLHDIFAFGTYFYLGSLLYVFKDILPFKWFYANILMAIALATAYTFLESITISIFFAYCFIIIGTSKELIDLKGENFSFGVYLYSFPIQQVTVFYFGYSINLWLHLIISSVLATLLAFLSWNFVEKPLLTQKDRL
ncbi:MAG: acyltransferase family protein [Segetibacter sp.]